MYFGATLSHPTLGLPGIVDWKSAYILYQQSIALTDLANAEEHGSVTLWDPTRQKIHGLAKLPTGIKTDYYQGRYYFPNLPPHLGRRLYWDPNWTNLVLRG